jgi:hypothetical protein
LTTENLYQLKVRGNNHWSTSQVRLKIWIYRTQLLL